MKGSQSYTVVFPFKGTRLLGAVHRPGGTRRRAPAVLFLHGFPGTEQNIDIQRRLLDCGIASFGLHFAGAWGSDGYYSFSGLVPQALAALRYLRRMEFVDARRTAVFGFSMGGWAAVNLGAAAEDLSAVAAVAPVGGPEMIASKTREFLSRASAPLRIRSKRQLYRDFVRAMREFDPARSAARLRSPLLLVHSRTDEVVPYVCSQRIFAAAAAPKKLVTVDGAAHDFLDRRDWLARTVGDWLARRLGARPG